MHMHPAIETHVSYCMYHQTRGSQITIAVPNWQNHTAPGPRLYHGGRPPASSLPPNMETTPSPAATMLSMS
jgi:hypothetical protein